MLHEGKGFEGCGHLGTNFRNVHYTVEVDVEVSTIKEVIKTAEKNSIKYSSTKSLIVISNCLIRTWNRYAEKKLQVSPECTLGKFWCDGKFAFPVQDVRNSVGTRSVGNCVYLAVRFQFS